MMSWQIRPFNPTQSEYKTIVALRNSIDPESPSSVAIWQHLDASRPKGSKFERWVVEDENGRLIAYAQLDETYPNSQKFTFNFNGLPAIYENGVAEALFEHVLQQIEKHTPQFATIQLRESETVKILLAQAFGFRQKMRYPISHLDVAKFDVAPYVPLFTKLKEQGIRIEQPPGGWENKLKWQKLIYNLDWEFTKEVPHHEVRMQTPFDEFVQQEFQHPNFLSDGYFIAFDGAAAVGMTNFVKRGGQTDRLATSITGVSRSHRRMGIATALKVRSIEYAQQLGAKIIVTNNEENNPMYLINVHLGFIAQPAWIDWEKQF